MKLERDNSGMPIFPKKAPSDAKELLCLMDEAAAFAQRGQGATAPFYDHGIRVFNQLQAHYQIAVARELAKAHEGLRSATLALKAATWLLAGITVLLGAVEIWKLFAH